jgi:hypothetical protein
MAINFEARAVPSFCRNEHNTGGPFYKAEVIS